MLNYKVKWNLNSLELICSNSLVLNGRLPFWESSSHPPVSFWNLPFWDSEKTRCQFVVFNPWKVLWNWIAFSQNYFVISPDTWLDVTLDDLRANGGLHIKYYFVYLKQCLTLSSLKIKIVKILAASNEIRCVCYSWPPSSSWAIDLYQRNALTVLALAKDLSSS